MVANTLKGLRETLGLPKAEMARRLAILPQRYGLLESGRKTPTYGELCKIVERFGVNPSQLFPQNGKAA